jgi:hypothetical protein
LHDTPLNLNSRPAGHKLGKPNLYGTAIKAIKKDLPKISLCPLVILPETANGG